MDNTQTLELQIKSTADGAVQSVKLLNSSLTKTKSTVDNVSKSISSMGKAFSMGGLYLGVKKLSTTFLKWMDLAVDRTEQLNLFNVVFKNMEKNGVKTFSTLGKQATQFQNKMNEAFGTNLTETTKYQGLFQSMGENVGIPDTYSALMSTTMTKLTYDLASLYNKQESTVAEALRAGVYAGQTKPLRSYGIDVTQTSMQPILDSLGITDRSVKQMSQAEKEILRYLATLRQAKTAMGDFANTIESPANQLKIFKQQLTEAKVALSSLFIGTFSKILPYANALLMVVKEVAKAIGTMFGIELSDYNTGIADSSDAFVDLGDSIDDATDSVKELKRQTLGFDQINNINENKDSGSGGASVSGGIDQRLLDAIYGYDNGMDKVKMKATEIRDKIMEWLGFTKKIDPLTKEISWKLDGSNSAMGKIISALKDIVKYGKEAVVGVFGEIKKDFDNGAFGKFLVGVFESIADLFKFIASHKEVQKIIAKTIEALLLIKTVKTVLNPVITLWKTFVSKIETGAKFVQIFGKQLKGTNNYIINSKGKLKEYNKTIEGHSNVVLNADKSVNKWKTALSGAKTALIGIGASVTGLYMINDAMKSISEEGPNVTNVLEGIVGSLTTIGGFATIGSIFGPIGTAIGAFTGAVTAGTLAFDKYWENLSSLGSNFDKLKTSVDNLSDSYKKMCEERKTTIESGISELDYYKNLWGELKNIADENGKIKKGYEDRANVITTLLSESLGIEIKIVDGQIQKYKELEQSIKDVITQKRAQVMLEAYEKDYAKAKNELSNAEQSYAKALKEVQEVEKKQIELINKLVDSGYSLEQATSLVTEGFYYNELGLRETSTAFYQVDKKIKTLRNDMEEATNSLKTSEDTLKGYTQTINVYEKAYGLAMENSWQALDEFLTYEAETYGKSEKETKTYYENKLLAHKFALENLKKNQSNYTKEEYEAEQNRLNNLIDLTKDKLKELNMTNIKSVEDLTPQMVDKWGTLAQTSEDEFLRKFGQLPSDIQTEIVDKMNAKGYSISEELQKGINSKKVKATVDIDADTKNFENKTKTLWDYWKIGINSIFGKADGGAFYGGSWHNIQQYANGGIPSHGSMFVAGEAGAELVGHINGRTEVLNQSQIASAIYSAVVSAMSQSGGQSIDVHVHTDEGTVVDRINQTTKQTGVCPINIPIN